MLCGTDIAVAIPEGHYGRVAPRSGLALKNFIDVGAGVIDADYRGPIGVLIFNFGDVSFKIGRGDRIAQLILERISTPYVEVVQELPETERGSGGFGSTGVALDSLVQQAYEDMRVFKAEPLMPFQ
jgi:dUTP pyrophosphatase